jgi:nitric oxide synthase oxygenase domain/subunit
LIILGILASVAVARFNNLEDSSNQRAIDCAISDLNSRETSTWANQLISTTGYDDDQQVLDVIDYNLGSDYTWTVPPDEFGGTLEFKGLSVAINRTPSTAAQPAFWGR